MLPTAVVDRIHTIHTHDLLPVRAVWRTWFMTGSGVKEYGVTGVVVINGERSKPSPSDKLSGEICLASHMLVCLSLYICIWCMYGLTTNTMPAHTLLGGEI